MNQKKFCFIICVNNQRYLEECVYYINHLYIPKGYEIDVLTIFDAVSITAGYNAGMQESNAKYKIYLHQDVFIVNQNFLLDLLELFQDQSIGMIGVIGSPKFPEHSVMWYGERVGQIYSSNVIEAGISLLHEDDQYDEKEEDKIYDVEAIDGMLMATQYDVRWREDLFTGWDFYDISQSFEFRRQGYRIVVPSVRQPWCIHDDGYNNLSNYFCERKKFMEEYIWKNDQ